MLGGSAQGIGAFEDNAIKRARRFLALALHERCNLVMLGSWHWGSHVAGAKPTNGAKQYGSNLMGIVARRKSNLLVCFVHLLVLN